eukprot:637945-Prorocentrum_lima.AAC.1
MTSSLVGSEMCIRDRPKPPLASRSGSKASQQRSAHSSSSRDLGLYAVSYTHLTLPTICSV